MDRWRHRAEGRVKRRRTRRERDSAKFGRRAAGARWPEPGPPPGVPPPPWGCRRAGRPLCSPVSAPRPVVITQRRLSQHLGMFNREVKSVDIERLLSPRRGPEAAPASPGRQGAGTETRPRAGTPAAPSPAAEPSPRRLACDAATEPGSGGPRPAAPAAAAPEPGRPEPGGSRAETPTPLSDQENVPPPGLEPGPGPGRGAAGPPWREIACQLRALLGRTLAFPGRDLAGERRRAILAVLLHRHRAYPDLSALLAHRTRAADAAPPDLGSPGTPEEEPLFPVGNFEADAAGQRRRSGGLPSACGCTPSPPPNHFSWTLGNEEAGGVCPESPAALFCVRGERRAACQESPAGREAFGRRAGALPRGELLPGSPPARFSPLEGPGLLCGAAPGAAPCCGASSEPAWGSRSRPEKALVDFGEDAAEGCSWSHGPPLATGDLGLDSTSPCGLPLAVPRQYGLSWRPAAEPCASQRLDWGAGPAHTSADVLGSAWSPGAFERAGRRLPRAPGWPRSARRPASPELCPRHGSRRPWPDRPLAEFASSWGTREPGRGRLPAPAEPGACCWERQDSPESRQPWGREAWELPEAGPGGSPEDAEWLRALRHLPVSFFPPSAALEPGCSPPSPALGCLWDCSSPEAWVFPRMKLY